MRGNARALCGALVVVVGVCGPPVVAAPPDPPLAVVGIADSGINPYHAEFRDPSPRANAYPGTYLPGYPAGAVALHLHLDVPDYWAAVRADCATWASLRPGQLYWVPGTRIVGAISFDERIAGVSCNSERPTGMAILDPTGHGTMAASRAVARTYGACPTCLVVSAQFPPSVPVTDPGPSTARAAAAIRWLAGNSGWIDAQSNSWGPVAPVWDPTGEAGLLGASPALVRAAEEASRAHLAFWASGNGVAFRYGVVGHPTLLTPHLGPSAIVVGGHDSGYVAVWPGFSAHVVSDACSSWAARHQTVDGSGDTVGKGTSAAAPFAAGGAAALLLESRRLLRDPRTGVRSGGVVAAGGRGRVRSGPLADGVLTSDEWRRVLLASATRRPVAQPEDGPACVGEHGATPLPWAALPDAFPEYPLIGYGAVDRPALALATDVLAGRAPAPGRSATDAWFAADRAVRDRTYAVWSGPPGPVR